MWLPWEHGIALAAIFYILGRSVSVSGSFPSLVRQPWSQCCTAFGS